jgi:hypothetical protein
MAKYGQQVRVRAVNRPKFKDFRENPPLIDRRWAFFARNRWFQRTELRGKTMITLDEEQALSQEQKYVALYHVYLELHLSLQGAMDAAAADLANLDGSEEVAEAA